MNYYLIMQYLQGLTKVFGYEEVSKLKTKLFKFRDENADLSTAEFVEKLEKTHPELKYLHQSVRDNTLRSINTSLNVIKYFVIISAILAIVGGIIIIAQSSGNPSPY